LLGFIWADAVVPEKGRGANRIDRCLGGIPRLQNTSISFINRFAGRSIGRARAFETTAIEEPEDVFAEQAPAPEPKEELRESTPRIYEVEIEPLGFEASLRRLRELFAEWESKIDYSNQCGSAHLDWISWKDRNFCTACGRLAFGVVGEDTPLLVTHC